ncbi:MAG: methyl-accepting chemotaxis protein [Treponema sp.]|jgi:methyl-accepting chemotaxis protein|nr:methyl-accepting chemotaxis protein [Treponema sp.]
MFFSKLKISTKLVISSAVFLIPIGVMLFFICSMTVQQIRKSMNEQAGINALKPAVTVMQNMPVYLDVYLGLEQGNLRELDEQISAAAKSLDRDMRRYQTEGKEQTSILNDWEALKKTGKDDEEIYQKYQEFTRSLSENINWIGERSRLILVSDMATYFFIAPALSGIPEALSRIVNIGNIIRKNLYEAESIVERWNSDLAAAQAQGRRVNARPFEGNPKTITMSMLATADLQLVRNSRILFESDRDRIADSIQSAIDGNIGYRRRTNNFEALTEKLDQYRKTVDILLDQYGRMSGFNVSTPSIAADYLGTVSSLNTDLCQLWNEAFTNLDKQIRRNTAVARARLVVYLLVVLVSLGLAIGFVVFITRDINSSVKSLNTLFKGLNENDLTLSLPINSGDEFGELMTAFNGFLNILRSTFGSFKHSAQLVADSVFDISSSSKEITTTANEQSASVSEIVSTMESSKNLSEQIALKTTEVAHLAKETQELSSKGAELREANQNMMEDIRKQNQKIISEIRNLSDMIIRISEAIRIIDGIADQTKLIAFNASLEASSSGEAGARFSVVASEIRRFADNVVESTREIKQKIEEVQNASQILIAEANNGSRQIEIGYEGMSEQKTVFEHIVDNSQNVATRSQQISNLSKQQELASSQIFSALKEISAGVKQFVIATSSTSKIADSLNGMSEDLKGKVETYRTE